MKKTIIILTILFYLIFIPSHSFAEEGVIELFDVDKNEVFERIPKDEVITDQLITYLQTINRVVPNVNPLKDAKLLIKIPLSKNIYLNTDIFQAEVSEAILV